MIEIYVDAKKNKGPNEMNGVSKGLRFRALFTPGESTFLKDREYDILTAEEGNPLSYLIENGFYILKKGKDAPVKSRLELAEDELEKAEQALKDAKTSEEQKAASTNLKQAKENLKQAIKADKKGK